MLYLGLESSCDESAIAVWDTDRRQLCYEKVLTQIDLHSAYGGVVPGIAIREHLNGFPILLKDLLKNVQLEHIDKIFVTHGPGLMGCLAMGVAYAQTLQLLLNVPLYGVNHLQGHALSPFLETYQNDDSFAIKNICPHLGLLVSGGNTLLFDLSIVNNQLRFDIIAQTIDDAAGEALDKGAKLLGFPYPGGPYIEKCARDGDKDFVKFPKAFPQKDVFKFSFSGIKTSLRYHLAKFSSEYIENNKASLCASYQSAVFEALTKKVSQALNLKRYRSIGLSGGVSNNDLLRTSMNRIAVKAGIPFYVPSKRYSGDNAAMIVFAGQYLSAPLRIDPSRTLNM